MAFIAVVLISVVLLYLYYRIFPDKIVDISPALGRWAVVTGATDGIGKSFARELAAKGFDVVLVSRTLLKLETVAKEIEEKFNVSTRIVQTDFNYHDDAMYSRIEADLENLEIGVLVNNVGDINSHPEYFLKLEEHHGHFYQSILNCNIQSVVNMTRLVLPGMVERGKGLIINISSQAASYPAPLHSLYGATKCFVTKFSQDLDTEYRDKVHIHVLTTGLVATKLSGLKKGNFLGPSPDVYVRSALNEVERRRCSDGYFWHTVVSTFISTLVFLFPDTVARLFRLFISYARKGLIKECRDCSPKSPVESSS